MNEPALQDNPEEVELPSLEWMQKNFRSRSAAIRYLRREYKMAVKAISNCYGWPYRQVFGIVRKMEREPDVHDKICPVCRRKS